MTLRAPSCAVLIIVAVLVITGELVRAHQVSSAPPASQCELSLQAIDQSWKGLCGPFLLNKDQSTLIGRKVQSLPGGAGRDDATATLMLVAEHTATSGTSSLEIELHGKAGVIRTQAGWYPITLTRESATTLRIQIDERTEVSPNNLDRRIVQRAAEILSTGAAWDRADDRECAPDDRTWSIYCSLYRASLDVSGGFHHRRPCLQVVRTILYERVAEERKKGRRYPHILADYNNDPTTRLADVQSVFADTVARMKR